MSDRFFASFKIGAPIPKGALDGLVAAIQKENLLDGEWNCVEIERPADIAKYVIDGELYFCDSEAREGQFPELEPFLQDRGIAFNRYSEGYGDSNAVRLYFRPGMSQPEERVCDNLGEEVVYRNDVKKLLDVPTLREVQAGLQRILGPEPALLRPIDASVFEAEGGKAE